MSFTLNKLQPLVKKRKRVGRGGSRGGTSGKGHKGQKARSGPTLGVSFEGGQMPLHRRLPKRGFTNARFKSAKEIVDLTVLENFFAAGDEITKEMLIEKGVLKGQKSKRSFKKAFRLKILGDGQLTKKLIVHADSFSESARKAIEENGGEARLIKGAE
jgi:large subunit ribosomal protein L15